MIASKRLFLTAIPAAVLSLCLSAAPISHADDDAKYDIHCGIHHSLKVFKDSEKTNNDYINMYQVIAKNLKPNDPKDNFYYCDDDELKAAHDFLDDFVIMQLKYNPPDSPPIHATRLLQKLIEDSITPTPAP
jgi:hypothetical protein